jgi:hypothetical protein
MLVITERLIFLFLILKQETLLLTLLFPCVCVSVLTQRSIYEAFFFFWVWDESARYGFQWLCGLLWAFVLWLLVLLTIFLLYHLPYPFLLKEFPFSNSFLLLYFVCLAIECLFDLLSCLGLKIPVCPALAQLLAACIDLAQSLSYLVLSSLVNQAVVSIFLFFSFAHLITSLSVFLTSQLFLVFLYVLYTLIHSSIFY